jgi:membrane carboxypeptidase/penicillin-binding protein PbpC
VQIITPKHKNTYILLEKNTVALNLQANSSTNKTLYWFDNKKLIGTTYNNEKLQYNFTVGKHTIVCIDEAEGNDTIEIFVNNYQ